MTNNKGITMISLVVTIILLILLSSIITYSGLSTITNNKFERLKIELDMVQANVNLWYEKYQNSSNDEITIGNSVPSTMLSKLQGPNGVLTKVKVIANEKGISMNEDVSRYRYFTPSDFEKLGIEGVENSYIIDVKKQLAILVEPYEFEGTDYYILDQVKSIVRGKK